MLLLSNINQLSTRHIKILFHVVVLDLIMPQIHLTRIPYHIFFKAHIKLIHYFFVLFFAKSTQVTLEIFIKRLQLV